MVFRPATLLLLATSLAGCSAVGPNYRPPAAVISERWLAPVSEGEPDDRWWQALGDPALTRLVESALADSLDIKEARSRLLEARAQRDAVRGRSLPTITAQGSATQDRLSENGQLPVGKVPGLSRDLSLFDVGFDASWEIDLWGRNRRAIEAAEARSQAAEENVHGAALSIIAEICRSYLDLRLAQAKRASADADAIAQEAIARLVAERYRAGEASRFDVARADAQARTTRSQVANFDADARSAAYRLAVLSGKPPEAMEWLLAAGELPGAQPRLGPGLRSDLLRRRPDIRSAERELAAAVAEVGVATADLFPRFSLLGSVGQQARDAGDLVSTGSTRFQVGPSLHWPIFSGGRLRALVRAADARSDAAEARFDRAVLQALADSEDALNRHAAAGVTRADTAGAREQAIVALELARQRYRAGEDDLVVLLNAQSAYSAAERRSLDARAAELQSLVSAYKALGGGWEESSI